MKKKDKIEPSDGILFSDAGSGIKAEVNEFAESLFSAVREYLLILDKNLRVIKASSSFYDLFKITPDETIGKSVYDLANHQWDIPRLRELLEKIISTKTVFNDYKIECDFTSIGKRIFLFNAQQIEIGKEKTIFLAMDDITERDRALKESEEKYLKVFRNSPYGITITYAEDGKFIEVNEAFTSITGFTREEVLADSSIGLKLWVNPDDRKFVVSTLLEGKEIKDKEFQFRLRNGNILDCMLSAQVLYLNRKPCIVSSITDISERKRIEKQLRESEERFRSLYEDSAIGLYRTTADGKIILANPTLVKMLGYPSFEKLAQRNLEKDGFEPAYDRKQFLERVEKEGEVKNLESIWTRTDGVVIYVSESTKVIRDSDGNTLYYDGTVEDISERKRVEKALRESKNELQVILESTVDGILAIDNNGKVIKTNKRFAELWRIPKALLDTKEDNAILNFAIGQLVNPEDFLSKVRLLYKSTDEDKDVLYFKDGRVFERYSIPLIMDDSSVGRVWSFRDITERKQAEESLRKSEEKYRYLIDNMNEGIYITDDNGVILFANNALAHIHGYNNPDELLNKNFIELVEPTAREKVLKNFENEIKASNSANEIEVPIVSADGSMAYVLVRPFVIRDAKGIAAVSGIVRDITLRKRAEEAIRKSEERYRGIFENIQDVYFETSIDGTILEVSPSIEVISKGQSRREDLIGKSMLDFYADPVERDALFSVLKQKGRAADYKVTLKNPDGALIPCSIFASILFDEKGHPKKIVGSMRDITERRKMEEELLRINKAVESSGEAICMSDSQGRHFYHNKAYTEIFGYTLEELEAAGGGPAIYADKEIAQKIFDIIMKGGLWRGEVDMVSKSGRKFVVLLHADAIIDENGVISGLVGIHTDITERKRAEETLVKLSSAIEQIVDTIVITNRDGIIEYVNPAFERLTGYSPQDAIGKTHRIIKSENQDREYYEELWKTILSGEVFRGEFVNKKKNGDLYYEEKTISPVFDKDKNIIHFVGTGVDITERKRVELIIQQQNIKLKELNASKDKFFSIIAHDLKSPFTGFLNLTEIMATESTDFTISEFAEFSRSLNDSAVNLFKLLENLLEWASIKQGMMSFNLKTLNLLSVVSNNILSISDRAAQKGISIVNLIDESTTVSADEKMLNTVFRNLLSNAVKFTKKEGKITVSAKTIENGQVEIAVSDTGVGISGKELGRLFKMDEKVGTVGTDNELSTGLGLLLCKEFVEKHGGRIWVESIERSGSTFYFTLTGSHVKHLVNS